MNAGETIFLETDEKKIEALLYQTMFDETIRLRNCKSKVERREIRRFILEAYQLYAEKNPNNVSQNICNGLAVGKEE